MEEILNNIMIGSIIDKEGNIIAANILDGPLGEMIVYAVAKGIKETAEKNEQFIKDTVEDIIKEYEDDLIQKTKENFNL